MLDVKNVDTIIKYLARLLRQKDINLVLGGDQGVQLIGTVDTSYAPDGDMASTTGSTLSKCTSHIICADSSMSAEGIECHL